MRKIAVIPPIPVTDYELERRQDRYSQLNDLDTEVKVLNLPGGPRLTDNAYDLFWATVYIILRAEIAAEEGCDAVVIDCTADPGVCELRQSLEVPVIGVLESSLQTVEMHWPGKKVAVLALDTDWKRMISRKIKDLGYWDRISSVEVVGQHVYSPEKNERSGSDRDIFREQLKAAADRAKESGADVLILGSTTIIGDREYLEEKTDIPVIDPGEAAVNRAKTMLGNPKESDEASKPAGGFGRVKHNYSAENIDNQFGKVMRHRLLGN